jgi:hypothetical protein
MTEGLRSGSDITCNHAAMAVAINTCNKAVKAKIGLPAAITGYCKDHVHKETSGAQHTSRHPHVEYAGGAAS